MTTKAGSCDAPVSAVTADEDDEHLPQATTIHDDIGYDTERIPSPEMEAILHRMRQDYGKMTQPEVYPGPSEVEKQLMSTGYHPTLSPTTLRYTIWVSR